MTLMRPSSVAFFLYLPATTSFCWGQFLTCPSLPDPAVGCSCCGAGHQLPAWHAGGPKLWWCSSVFVPLPGRVLWLDLQKMRDEVSAEGGGALPLQPGPAGGLLLRAWPWLGLSGVALRWDSLLVSYYNKTKMPSPTRWGKSSPTGAAILVPPWCPVAERERCLLEQLGFDLPAGGQFAPGAKLVLPWFAFVAEPLILLI